MVWPGLSLRYTCAELKSSTWNQTSSGYIPPKWNVAVVLRAAAAEVVVKTIPKRIQEKKIHIA
jgi:hypothetical protein